MDAVRSALALLALLALSCRQAPAPAPDRLPLLLARSGLELSADAALVAEEPTEGRGEAFSRSFVHSPTNLGLDGEGVAVPAPTVFEVLRRSLPAARIGQVADRPARAWSFKRGGDSWNATVVTTTTGQFLILERFPGTP